MNKKNKIWIIISSALLLVVLTVNVLGLDREELADRTDEQLRNNLDINYSHTTQDIDNIYFYFGINNIRQVGGLFIEQREYIRTVLETQEILLCLQELGRECYERIINRYEPLDLPNGEEVITVETVKSQLLNQARYVYSRQLELRDEAARDQNIINNFLIEGVPEDNVDVRQ